jgi:hypothetical protein
VSRNPLSALALGLLAAPALGDAWDWNLNVNAEAGYDDNWNLSVKDPVDGYRIRITPDVFLRWETDRAMVEADVGVRLERYFADIADDRIDRQDPFASLTGRYLLPRGSVGGAARYTKEALVESEFEDTGVVSGRGSRTLIGASAFWTHELTELDSLTLSGGYAESTYTDDAYTDYDNWTAAVTLNRALTERTTAFVSANAQLYRPESGAQPSSAQDAVYFNLGLRHEISPTWSGNVSGGYGVIQRELDDDTVNGWLADLGFTRVDENGSLSFGGGRQIRPSGAGELAVSDRIYADYSRQLSERWNAGLSASWSDNRYPFDEGKATVVYGDYSQFQVAPRVSYQLAPEWRVSASYRYRQQERDTDGDSAESNAVFLTIGYVPERP